MGPVIVAAIPARVETIIVLRFVLAAPVLMLLLRLTKTPLSMRQLLTCVPGGMLLPLQVGLFFTAARRTSVADATFLMGMQPLLMLALGAPLLGERATTRIKLCAVGGVVGLGLVISGSSASGTFHLRGELSGLASLACWTAYLIVSKRARMRPRAPSALQYQAGINLVGAVVAAVATLVFQVPVTDVDTSALIGIGYVIVVSGIVGHGLITWSQRYLEQSVISTILLVQPVVGEVGGAVFLGQPLTAWSILGSVLVVGCGAVALKKTSSVREARNAVPK